MRLLRNGLLSRPSLREKRFLLLTRDDGELVGAVLLPGDPLGLLHEQRAEALVLELAWVPGGDGHHAAVHVQLADDGDAVLQLRPDGEKEKRPLFRVRYSVTYDFRVEDNGR